MNSGEFQELQDGKLWSARRGNRITLGVTSLAIEEIGALDRLELPSEGMRFDEGEAVLTLDGVQGSLEIMAPSAGTIHEVNHAAQRSPEIIAEDPLEEGWLVCIEIEDSELES